MNHLVSHPFNQHRIAIDISIDTHLYFKHFPSSLTVYGGEDRSVDVQESSLLEETMNGHGCRVSETQNSGKSSRVCSQVRVLSDIFQSVDRATFKWIILPKNSNLQKFFQHIVPFLKCKKKVYWLYILIIVKCTFWLQVPISFRSHAFISTFCAQWSLSTTEPWASNEHPTPKGILKTQDNYSTLFIQSSLVDILVETSHLHHKEFKSKDRKRKEEGREGGRE